MLKMQITLFDKTGKYKPISTVIEVQDAQDYKARKKEYNLKAVKKMAARRYLTIKELQKQGYTQLKAREYTTEQLEKDRKKNELKRMYKAFKERQQKE